jgi:DNA-binding response OmpR family regulator
VRSKDGGGSTFWLALPLGVGEAVHPPALPPVALLGARLLVVDDSAHAARVLADLLRALQFRVQAVHDSAQAVRAVALAAEQGDPYGALLLDWNMPGAGGAETVREIRALALPRQPALMMLSLDGREDVLGLARSAGIAEFLQKPVQAGAVHAAVVRLLERHVTADPVDSSFDLPPSGSSDDDAQSQGVLDGLMQLLRDSDATACDIWKQNRRMLRSRFGEQSSMIERAIEDFDFERAAELAATALPKQVAPAAGR